MTMTEIERALRALRLSGIAATLGTRLMQAQASQQPFLETFAAAAVLATLLVAGSIDGLVHHYNAESQIASAQPVDVAQR